MLTSQARNAAKAPTGKLGAQLAAQQGKSHFKTLKMASEDEVRQRQMDAQAATLAHN